MSGKKEIFYLQCIENDFVYDYMASDNETKPTATVEFL